MNRFGAESCIYALHNISLNLTTPGRSEALRRVSAWSRFPGPAYAPRRYPPGIASLIGRSGAPCGNSGRMSESKMGLPDSVGRIKVATNRGERAPHKPLLLLHMLGRYFRREPRLIPFSEIDEPLKQLLIEFGRPRSSYRTELPFWHLRTDGFWDIQNVDLPSGRTGNPPPRSQLLQSGAVAGLSQAFYESLQDQEILSKTVEVLLTTHFPDSIHEDILQAVGIDLQRIGVVRRRDPKFREKVMRAYESECAVCGFTSRLGNVLVGVEGAHIKWHQAGGPDTPSNGVALCPLHHKLFDRGVISLDKDHRLMVSELATGSTLFEHLVTTFHGQKLKMPIRTSYNPDASFVAWHAREVFRPPNRELKSA